MISFDKLNNAFTTKTCRTEKLSNTEKVLERDASYKIKSLTETIYPSIRSSSFLNDHHSIAAMKNVPPFQTTDYI
jgi:hypothetical protein